MACCFMSPGHYLNQSWLLIIEVFKHSPEDNFQGIALIYVLKIINSILKQHLSGSNELITPDWPSILQQLREICWWNEDYAAPPNISHFLIIKWKASHLMNLIYFTKTKMMFLILINFTKIKMMFPTYINTSVSEYFYHCQSYSVFYKNMEMILLCFDKFGYIIVFVGYLGRIYPYNSELLHWHRGNHMVTPVPVNWPCWIWVNRTLTNWNKTQETMNHVHIF